MPTPPWRSVAEWLLVPAGAGLLSAIAGSAGPLGAAAFLSLKLPAQAYVAGEAVTAVLMHLTKSTTYGRYAAMTLGDFPRGLALVGSLVVGSWTGRKLIDRMPEEGFALLVGTLLVIRCRQLRHRQGTGGRHRSTVPPPGQGLALVLLPQEGLN